MHVVTASLRVTARNCYNNRYRYSRRAIPSYRGGVISSGTGQHGEITFASPRETHKERVACGRKRSRRNNKREKLKTRKFATAIPRRMPRRVL